MALTFANIKAITDNIAFTKQITDTFVGSASSSGSLLHTIAAQITRIVALANSSKQRYIQDTYKALAESITTEDLIAMELRGCIAKLNANVEKNSTDEDIKTVSDFWAEAIAEAETEDRMAPEAAQLSRAAGIDVTPSIVFPPVTVLGTVALTGKDEGTFTDGVAVDTTLYGGGDIEAEATHAIGAVNDLDITVTGYDENGERQTWEGSFTKEDVLGTKVDLVNDCNARCVDVINIEFDDGNADDAFKVQTKLDRIVAA